MLLRLTSEVFEESARSSTQMSCPLSFTMRNDNLPLSMLAKFLHIWFNEFLVMSNNALDAVENLVISKVSE
jgi:hypothetical protein